MKTAIDVLDGAAAPNIEAIGTTHAASALQAHVLRDGELALEHCAGVAQFDPDRPLSIRTPFDLASVTKVFTATLALIAIDEERIGLETPVADYVELWTDEHRPVTFLDLLNHSSGLPAWDQFYLRMPIQPTPEVAAETRLDIEAQIVAKPRKPPGVRGVYSDLGYILLGRLLERVFDERLEDAIERRICEPLGLSSIRFVTLRRGDAPILDAAATEVDPRRGGVMVGSVHDENCYIQGGAEGHAGLFGTASDVAKFGHHLLNIDRGGDGIVSSKTLHRAWSAESRGGDGHHLAGWDTPSGPSSSAGRGFGRSSTVGHLGFTGTSLWIEREQGVVAALLTNRVYPTRENALIKDLRVAFHEAVLPAKP